MAVNTLSAERRQEQRENIAKEFVEFRHNFLFRQIDLAHALRISRRSVQMVEAGNCLPQVTTRARFRAINAEQARRHREVG